MFSVHCALNRSNMTSAGWFKWEISSLLLDIRQNNVVDIILSPMVFSISHMPITWKLNWWQTPRGFSSINNLWAQKISSHCISKNCRDLPFIISSNKFNSFLCHCPSTNRYVMDPSVDHQLHHSSSKGFTSLLAEAIEDDGARLDRGPLGLGSTEAFLKYFSSASSTTLAAATKHVPFDISRF